MGNLLTGLGIIVAVALAVFGVLFSTHKTVAIWILFFTITLPLLVIFIYWQQQIWNEENPTRISRDAEIPKVAPEPQLEPPRFTEKIRNVTFSLGGGGVHVSYDLSELEEKPREPFKFGDYSPVRVYVENGKLYADVTVYGGAGKNPIEIKKNEFSVAVPNWDRNSNSAALEIVNENQAPVFQLIYMTPNHIVVNGIFPYPGGLILASESGMIINPTATASFSLKPIFKYPSWKHPGQYETGQK